MAKLVNWYEFTKKLKERNILLFSARDVRRLFNVSKIAADFLLYRYAKKGFIVRVKRGLYAFPDALPPEFYIANRLYEPSYVSLQAVLSWHGVIPETVYEITCVTTKSTRRFEKLGKVFSFRRMKKSAFTGYVVEKQKGFSFLIADPEKAFVDTSYFRIIDGLNPISRFDKEKINAAKALRYAALFASRALTNIVKTALR
jgi:predicted transcriptional regulator of viral defense system